jgi:hypothetical protein
MRKNKKFSVGVKPPRSPIWDRDDQKYYRVDPRTGTLQIYKLYYRHSIIHWHSLPMGNRKVYLALYDRCLFLRHLLLRFVGESI